MTSEKAQVNRLLTEFIAWRSIANFERLNFFSSVEIVKINAILKMIA